MFGFSLAYVSGLPVFFAMVGSVLPDTDILMDYRFPFQHRGILHTPVAAGFAALSYYLLTGRKIQSLSLFTGYLSHLFIDSFTYSGIMWLFPLETAFSFGLVSYDNQMANLGIVLLSIAVAAGWRHRAFLERWWR